MEKSMEELQENNRVYTHANERIEELLRLNDGSAPDIDKIFRLHNRTVKKGAHTMRTKYFLAMYRDTEGKTQTDIYTDDMEGWEQYHSDTFSPDTEPLKLIRYQTTGKTYKDRKADAAEKARETQEIISESVLYWSQLATLSDIMETYASRYGLKREFTENGII